MNRPQWSSVLKENKNEKLPIITKGCNSYVTEFLCYRIKSNTGEDIPAVVQCTVGFLRDSGN